MPTINARCVATTLCVALSAPGLVRADASTPSAGPSAGETMAAFHEVQAWVRKWSVPAEPAPIDPAGTTAVCLTLRLSGRVMGRATVVADSGASLWRAARSALAQAAQSMPVERDALKQDRLLSLAPSVEIDLQVAGPWTPIVADTLTAAALSVAPARQGIGARIGERAKAVFPGVMASTNRTPGDGISAVLGALGLAPTTPLTQLRQETGLVLYRFDVQHLAQPTAGAEPLFLSRSGRTIAAREVTPASLRQFGDRLAINLLRRRWPGEEPFGVRGAYLPWRDAYEPDGAADPLDQALAAYALARWSTSGHGRDDLRDTVRATAERILRDLAIVGAGETDPTHDPAVASLRTLAAVTLSRARAGADPGGPEPPPPAAPMLAGPPVSVTQPDTEALAAPVRALRAYANAEVARYRGLDTIAQSARAEVRALFAQTPPASLPGLMPWLGFAELALVDPDAPAPAAIALREFRDLVESRQITLADASPTADEDLVGGVVFSAGDAALPTWHSLRPIVFLARMLGDERLTAPEERPAHLARLLDGLRYTRQLAADDAVCAIFPARPRALWGVRAALWDQRQPVEATAMALVLVAESLDAVDAILADGSP